MPSLVRSCAGISICLNCFVRSTFFCLWQCDRSLMRWFFNNETPQLLAAASACRWVAVGFRSQRHRAKSNTGCFKGCFEGCQCHELLITRTGRAPARCAVFDRDAGGGTWIACGARTRPVDARPVVACSDTGQFLAAPKLMRATACSNVVAMNES